MHIFYNIIHKKQHNYSKKQLDGLMAQLFINPTYNNQSDTAKHIIQLMDDDIKKLE